MYDERRNRNMGSGYFINGQRAKWRWDSHLWGKGHTADHIYTRCMWCGWQPPTEYPLSDETPLCKENPDIKAILKNLGDKIAGAMRDALISGDIKGMDDVIWDKHKPAPACPFCGRIQPESDDDILCQFCGKTLRPPEDIPE